MVEQEKGPIKYLFCYGTLMRKLYNYKAMGMEDSECLGKGSTVKEGRMLCVGLIPFVSFSNGKKNRVKGEIFSVTEEKLNYLDTLEFPYGYVREEVEVEMEDMKFVKAVIYTFNKYSELNIPYEEESCDFWNYIET